MPKIQFCESCMEIVERTEANKVKNLPVPEVATETIRIHDGSKVYLAHLCERHSGVAMVLAVEQWGHQPGDTEIAYPADIH